MASRRSINWFVPIFVAIYVTSPIACFGSAISMASGSGSLAGQVHLQGQSGTIQATVLLNEGWYQKPTEVDGSFTIGDLPARVYTVTISKSGYLPAERTGVTIAVGSPTTLPEVTLLGGDASDDGKVGVSDLVIVASNFNLSPPTDGRADINRDDRVDLFDLILVGANFGRTQSLWPD